MRLFLFDLIQFSSVQFRVGVATEYYRSSSSVVATSATDITVVHGRKLRGTCSHRILELRPTHMLIVPLDVYPNHHSVGYLFTRCIRSARKMHKIQFRLGSIGPIALLDP